MSHSDTPPPSPLNPAMSDVLPPVSNDNNPLLYDGWTPEAALAACQKARAELIEKHSREGSLPTDGRSRRLLTLLGAFEACLRWHHFRNR